MKFIEAKANLRLGNQGIATANITTCLAQANVSPANVTLNQIITQKYISF